MASNKNNKKLSNRRKIAENEKLGIHSIPEEVVEIERNIIENWMISIKRWLHINPSTARKIILGSLMVVIIFFLLLFTHSAVMEKQNAKFYSILLSYEKLKDDNNVINVNKDRIKKLQEHSNKLCNSLWSTRYSNNGCLMSAILSNEMGNKKEAAEFLAKFSKNAHNNALAANTAFLSGYLYESNHDLDQSLELYKKVDSFVDEKIGKDFTLFHKGRVYYYNNKLSEAENSFKEIIEKHKDSSYYSNAKNYLLLVQMKKTKPSQVK